MLTKDHILAVVGKVWWENNNVMMDFLHKHMSRAGARIFAREHCVFAAHFPQWFGNIIGNCPHLAVRRYMIGNMHVEEVNDPTIEDGHYESMVKFAIGLGFSRDEVLNYEPSISMQMALAYWDHVSRTKPWIEAFGAIGGLELQNHAGLAARYGEKPLVMAEYWRPLALDEKYLTHWKAAEAADPHEGGHSDETLRILCEYAKTPEQEKGVLETLTQSLSVFRYQYEQIGKAAIEVSRKPA